MRIVIVGGVAGGMSTATRLRRLDEESEIVVFERGPEVSYANCGLPYYVGGVISERSQLLLQTPESLHRRFRLDVRVRHEILTIDRGAKTVTVRDTVRNTEALEPYDKLVLAVGAQPRIASDLGGIPVRNMRTVEDADEIIAVLPEHGHRAVAVLGGGYTGLEAAENLAHRGALVTLVHRGPHLLSPLDPEMTSPAIATLRAHGVEVRLNTDVTGADADGLQLSDGSHLPVALVVDATGITPETWLAKHAGLLLGPTGGIHVDEHCRTSDPDIFAVGDSVEKNDLVGGSPALVAMAGLANRHGRMVADIIAGGSPTMAPALGTGIVEIFGLALAKVGWSERRAREAGIPHYVVHVHPSSHAGYYPGAETLAMKLIAASDDDRILGAQVVGRDGVDKRIDVIATAMQAGIPAARLAGLELAYAPQFGSAKDAVNILGYVAENTRTGTTPTVQWHELDAACAAGATLLDVRDRVEFDAGSIPGAINIPLDELRARRDELPDGELIVHCQVGQRGHYATRILAQWGRRVRNLDGGYRTWLAGEFSG